MVADGSGGVILAWTDGRPAGEAEYDIYAQRLDANGSPLWTADGVLVTAAPSFQYWTRIVSDGAGGAIISWEDNRAGGLGDIYAQRVSAAGVALWTPNGVGVSTLAAQQSRPESTSDGQGGIIITWYDGRFGDFDVFVQRLDADGNALWLANGLDITNVIDTGEVGPKIVGDGIGGATVVWEDLRSGGYDLYGVRIDASGVPQHAPVAICRATDTQQNVVLARDPLDGDVVVAWVDTRVSPGSGEIFAQRFDTTGKVKWDFDGVPVVDISGSQIEVRMALDSEGNATFAWEDFRDSSSGRLYAQRLSPAGIAQWESQGAVVADSPGTKRDPFVVPTGAGDNLIVWSDRKTGDADIYAQRIEATHGYFGHPEPTLATASDVPGDQGGFVDVNWTPSDHDVATLNAISHYSVWRATDAVPAAAQLVAEASIALGFDGPAYRAAATGDFFWEYVGQQAAQGFSGYSFVVPTRANLESHFIQVVSHTFTPFVVFPSAEIAASSVDNLAPGAPQALIAERTGASTVSLEWDPNVEQDLQQYAVYRSTSPAVPVESGNLLFVSTETEAVDPNADPGTDLYYVVVAIDVNANMSDPSNEVMVTGGATSADGTPRMTGPIFHAPHPNPFNPSTALDFEIDRPQVVRLEILDVRGRSVTTLVQGYQGAGPVRAHWNGMDRAGNTVGSGVYFARLVLEDWSSTRRLVLIK